jgi:hypothetical protein
MKSEVAKQWLEKIEQQKASGKNAAVWCRENGIPYKNYLKWRKRLSSTEDLNRSSFVESEEVKDDAWLEITMHGAKCTFTKRFDRKTMGHLLEVLKGV